MESYEYKALRRLYHAYRAKTVWMLKTAMKQLKAALKETTFCCTKTSDVAFSSLTHTLYSSHEPTTIQPLSTI